MQKTAIKRDRKNRKIEENSKESEKWRTKKTTLQVVFASLSCIKNIEAVK